MIWLNAVLVAVSLLAVFPAPAQPLWFLAIGVTEWSHLFAGTAFLLAFVSWRMSKQGTMATGLALIAGVLFLSPLARAGVVAHRLPAEWSAAFGPIPSLETSRVPGRAQPLQWKDLLRGRIASPPVQVSARTYANYQGQPLQLDLYQPLPAAANRPLPGVIVVHGGSWRSGDRGDFPDLDRYLAARGYIVASIDYRLAPGALFPAQREDVFAAIAYLKAHAAEIGLDPERLVLLGRSAGGQIALSAAYALKEPAIKGVIAVYTPNDLAWGYSIPCNPLILNSRKVIENYLGGPPTQIPEAYEAASPLRFVNARTPPTLMIHGARDELVAAEHDERLAGRLREFHRPFYYLHLPWATHGCDANFSGPSGQLSTYVIERFLAAVTKG